MLARLCDAPAPGVILVTPDWPAQPWFGLSCRLAERSWSLPFPAWTRGTQTSPWAGRAFVMAGTTSQTDVIDFPPASSQSHLQPLGMKTVASLPNTAWAVPQAPSQLPNFLARQSLSQPRLYTTGIGIYLLATAALNGCRRFQQLRRLSPAIWDISSMARALLAGGSIRQYLAPIKHRNLHCGYIPPPTEAALVGLVKAGYRRDDRGRRGPPTRHLPLPATVVLGSLQRVMAAVRWGRQEVGDAEVVARMQAMARPSSVRALHRAVIKLSRQPKDITVRLRIYKGDDRGFVPTRTVNIPHDGADDIIYRFSARLKRSSRHSIFAHALPLSKSVARAVSLAGVFAPPGFA